MQFTKSLTFKAKTGISIEDYRGQDVQLKDLLEKFQYYIETEVAKWSGWTKDYISNKAYVTGQTLQDFENFPFDNIVTFAQRQQIRLETALNDRIQVQDIAKHTDIFRAFHFMSRVFLSLMILFNLNFSMQIL